MMVSSASSSLLDPSVQRLLSLAAQAASRSSHGFSEGLCPKHAAMSERNAATEGASILHQICLQLSEDDEFYARVLLEQSAVMRADPTMVTTICRVRRVLSTKPLRLHSAVLRTVIEQLAIEGGVSAYVAIWLQEVDEALRTIIQNAKERYGTEVLKALDGEAERLGLPTWFWWEYPARTAEEGSPKLL